MKVKRRVDILTRQGAEKQPWFEDVTREIGTAIAAVVSPTGADKFLINPTKQANGVKPIKIAFETCLREHFGWQLQARMGIEHTGKLDAMRNFPHTSKTFAVEWETGNISSSHRALNKIALGILEGKLIGGALIVPSRTLYRYLTDRIGSFSEISTYFPMWGRLAYNCPCVISVYEVEHDGEDVSIPVIKKGKDGMAQGLVSSRICKRATKHR